MNGNPRLRGFCFSGKTLRQKKKNPLAIIASGQRDTPLTAPSSARREE